MFLSTRHYPTLADPNLKDWKRYTKTIKFQNYDLIFLPINMDNAHWTCILIDAVNHEIIYYDSMQSVNSTALETVRTWSEKYLSLPSLGISWNTVYDRSFPIQANGYDCGLFVLFWITYRSLYHGILPEKERSFESNTYRLQIGCDLLRGEIGFFGDLEIEVSLPSTLSFHPVADVQEKEDTNNPDIMTIWDSNKKIPSFSIFSTTTSLSPTISSSPSTLKNKSSLPKRKRNQKKPLRLTNTKQVKFETIDIDALAMISDEHISLESNLNTDLSGTFVLNSTDLINKPHLLNTFGVKLIRLDDIDPVTGEPYYPVEYNDISEVNSPSPSSPTNNNVNSPSLIAIIDSTMSTIAPHKQESLGPEDSQPLPLALLNSFPASRNKISNPDQNRYLTVTIEQEIEDVGLIRDRYYRRIQSLSLIPDKIKESIVLAKSKYFIKVERDWLLCNNAPHLVSAEESSERLPDVPFTNKDQKPLRGTRSRKIKVRSLEKIKSRSQLGINEVTHWLNNLTISKDPPRFYCGDSDYRRLQNDLISSFTTQWNMGLVIKPLRFNSPHNLPAFIDRVNLDLQSLLITMKSKYKGSLY